MHQTGLQSGDKIGFPEMVLVLQTQGRLQWRPFHLTFEGVKQTSDFPGGSTVRVRLEGRLEGRQVVCLGERELGL